MGKGVPAALLMASIHAAIRTHAPIFQDRCGELLANLNSLLYESTDAGMFATVFYGIYDDASGMLTYANAGHEPPFALRGDRQECIRLEPETPPAGVCKTIAALERSIQLELGDSLLIFTDGITEARNSDDEEFGADRLLAAIGGRPSRSAEGTRDEILSALRHHSRGVAQADDVTLIVAHVLRAQEANG
jgi:sigma-B regulation protein RsbU (phosphoserine phosphatase)